jgi:hypothetical protein
MPPIFLRMVVITVLHLPRRLVAFCTTQQQASGALTGQYLLGRLLIKISCTSCMTLSAPRERCTRHADRACMRGVTSRIAAT